MSGERCKGEAEGSDHVHMSQLQGALRYACLALDQRWELTKSCVHQWLVFEMHCIGLCLPSSVTEWLYRSRFLSFAAVTSHTTGLAFSPCCKCFVDKVFLLPVKQV